MIAVLMLSAIVPILGTRGGWDGEAHYPKGVYLKGSWISCPDDQGIYAERSYEHYVLGKPRWTFHLGPDTEFSLFVGPDPDEHRAHDGPLNLLGRNYRENVDTYRRARTWRIPGLKLWISVVAGGGSWTDCSSWFVLVQQT